MEAKKENNTDLCVCCGKPVPEGRMVCYACETGSKPDAPARSPKCIIKKLWGRKTETK